MDLLEAILTRRSIRKFSDKEVSKEQLEIIIKAGMYAPSAINEQPWHFIIIKDRELLRKMSVITKGTAQLADVTTAIVLCADMNVLKAPDSWYLDCAAAVQNMLLTAHSLGLGSVWTSIYPNPDCEAEFRKYIEVPGNIKLFCVLPVGYPDEVKENEERFNKDRIHTGKW